MIYNEPKEKLPGNDRYKQYEKNLPNEIKLLKKLDNYPLPLPRWLEDLLKKAKTSWGDKDFEFRRNLAIQRIIDGAHIDPQWYTALESLGIKVEDLHDLPRKVAEFERKINPAQVNKREIIPNLVSFFQSLKLKELLKPDPAIISLGCGTSPEASSLNVVFSDTLVSFTGYDRNQALLDWAIRDNPDPKNTFINFDFSQGLPEADPDLVIIRQPNIFQYEKAG